MLGILVSFMAGGELGVILMCLLQINRTDEWKEWKDYENRDFKEKR